MNERVLNLLSMCFQATEKGHHVFFYYTPHVDMGEIVISAYVGGWVKDVDPTRRFYISLDGKVRYLENSLDDVEKYLKELIA